MRSVPFLTCCAAAVISLAIGVLSYLAFDRAADQLQRSQLEAIARQFDAGMASAGRMVTSQADIIAGLPGLTQAVANRDREGVLTRLSPSFGKLRDQFGVDLQQVATRDNIVLARVHNPTQFGDDISKTRAMVVQANVSGLPQSGLEAGTTGLRVRSVVPIMFQGQQVGTMEVGQRIERILENLRTSTGADLAILLNAEAERNVRRPADAAQPPRFGELLGDTGTNWPLFSDIAQHVAFAQVKEPAFQSLASGGHSYAMLTLALADYNGHPIGDLVAVRALDDNMKFRRGVLVQITTVSVVGAVMLICLILLVLRGLVLVPVSAAAAALETMAEGGEGAVLPQRQGRDAVARLFAAIERLRLRRQPRAVGSARS